MMPQSTIAHLFVAATLALAALGCGSAPAPSGGPAIIDEAGRVSSQSTDGHQNDYVFNDGRATYVMLSGRRLINGGLGDVVFLGHDANGPFLAAFMTQDGLPSNCYVDNAQGIDRGAYIELRGILWAKATQFTSPVRTRSGDAYPGATRFCFSDQGQIWSVVAG